VFIQNDMIIIKKTRYKARESCGVVTNDSFLLLSHFETKLSNTRYGGMITMSIAIAEVTYHSIMTGLMLTIVDDLTAGALAGVLAGVVVGAIVWPVIQAPDTLGRGVLLALLFGLGMAIFELARISVVTGASLGSIINAFQGATGTLLGQMILDGSVRVLIAFFAGAVIGVGMIVPQEVIKGSLVGLLLGSVSGAILQAVLGELDISLGRVLFSVVVGLATWGFLAAIGGE
jgi:hypothetical protein